MNSKFQIVIAIMLMAIPLVSSPVLIHQVQAAPSTGGGNSTGTGTGTGNNNGGTTPSTGSTPSTGNGNGNNPSVTPSVTPTGNAPVAGPPVTPPTPPATGGGTGDGSSGGSSGSTTPPTTGTTPGNPEGMTLGAGVSTVTTGAKNFGLQVFIPPEVQKAQNFLNAFSPDKSGIIKGAINAATNGALINGINNFLHPPNVPFSIDPKANILGVPLAPILAPKLPPPQMSFVPHYGTASELGAVVFQGNGIVYYQHGWQVYTCSGTTFQCFPDPAKIFITSPPTG